MIRHSGVDRKRGCSSLDSRTCAGQQSKPAPAFSHKPPVAQPRGASKSHNCTITGWWRSGRIMECGSLLPLSACLLAGALGAGSKPPAQKAGASSRTPNRHDFDGTLLTFWEITLKDVGGGLALPLWLSRPSFRVGQAGRASPTPTTCEAQPRRREVKKERGQFGKAKPFRTAGGGAGKDWDVVRPLGPPQM